MKVLIAYDVATGDGAGERRLRRVARACQDYGQRVQKSVFECTLGALELVQLRGRLLSAIDPSRDSLRMYFLDKDVTIETHGVALPWNLDGPLVV